MKKILNSSIYNTTLILLIIVTGVLIFAFPRASIKAAQESIITCLSTLVPSLFPFMVISLFLTQSNIAKYIFALPSALISRLSGLNKRLCDVFFTGIIGGYPAAAKNICVLVKNGELDKNDASTMLCFCTNAGPSFLITAVGCRMFLSTEIGLILYISSVLSSISILLIYSNKIKYTKQANSFREKNNYSNIFIECVKSSCSTMTLICALVIIFSVFLSFLSNVFNHVPFFRSIMFGIFEVTHGCISASYDISLANILLASAICAFGGLCVIFQIKAICFEHKISIKSFVFSRLINILFNILYTFLLLLFIPINTKQTFISNTQSTGANILTSPLPMLMLILCCVSLPISLSQRKKSNFF